MNIEALTRLKENLEKCAANENSLIRIYLELFNRKRLELAKNKGEELKSYFESKCSYYGQKLENFDCRIAEDVNLYTNEIQKIVNAYEELFICILKIMQSTQNDQKTCISNIAVLEGEKISYKNVNSDLTEEDIEEINKQIDNLQFAYTQKKVNLQVIVNECSARILWILENMSKDIDSTYKTKEQALLISKGNNNKFLKKIKNLFTGKRNFERFIEQFEIEGLDVVNKDVEKKINYVSYVLEGILKQTQDAKKKIQETESKKQKVA